MNRSVVVAITGGIGTGKTTIAGIIADMGYPVISSDKEAKELMVKDAGIREKLIKEFGEDFYSPDGNVNNSFVPQLVFGQDEESLRRLGLLNSIVHPAVIENMINTVGMLEEKGEKLIFVESALTYEAGLEDGFDYIVVADAPEDVCIERVKARSGLSGEQIRQRMASQMPQKEKVSHADFVIDNSGSYDRLKQAVEFAMIVLKNVKPREPEEDENE